MHRIAPHCLLLLILFLPSGAGAETRLELNISGVEGELLANVRALLSLERDKGDPRLTGSMIERLHRRAPREIRRALQPFGFYRPEIVGTLEPPAPDRPAWLATYRIDPKDPVRIETAEIGVAGPGADDPALAAESRGFPLQSGAVLDHRRYEDGKRDLLQTARRLGYLDARLTRHRVEVDPKSYQARVELRMDTGPLYRLGSVQWEQQGFELDYLQSFVPFRPGDPFTPDSLAELRRALGASGAFARVDVERLPAAADDPTLIPLKVSLTPNKPNLYRARVGWGTDTGLGLHLDWYRRYLGERGHSLRTGIVLVEERSKLAAEVNYLIPIDPLAQSRLELFARHQGKDLSYQDVELPEGGKTRILGNTVGVLWPRPRRTWNGLTLEERIGLSFLSESYDVFDVLFGHYSPFLQDLIEDFLGDDRQVLQPSFRVLTPSIGWTLRRSDDVMYPRRGDFLDFELRGALDGLGSNVSFWQARLRSVFIRPVRQSDRLILRGDLAFTDADTIRLESLGDIAFNQLPEFYEFRTGGARSVRGYGFETLLPEDSVTGGKHLVVTSLEYEKALITNWSAAAFLDLGNAFNDFSEFDLKQGAGVGVRWRSPVGLVRLDLAVPLGEADDPFQLYLTIGPEF
jgi:translocation and assembly module TamA